MPAKEASVTLPFGPPPVLPDVGKQLQEYLLCPDKLPMHDYKNSQEFWPRVPIISSLYHYELSPINTTLKVERDPTTGKLLQFQEVAVDIGCTAKNSLSFRRTPGPPSETVKGHVGHFPFWPGGFPDISTLSNISNGVEFDTNFKDDLLTVAPGFSNGVEFNEDGFTLKEKDKHIETKESIEEEVKDVVSQPPINLMEILRHEEQLIDLWKENEEEEKRTRVVNKATVVQDFKLPSEDLQAIPEKDNIPVLKISEAAPTKTIAKLEWAETIDISVPVTDFHQKIPEMAHKFKFELDHFQKQAILRVEKHENVFVAAHTSAGKTVVAEYAIALSKRHMTRAIYTSPIKALSNQKYCDFKETFGDVGLITGDFQINQKANCLIMTTEILRSMLYRGSETIRDLEFVIFDEVHYVNDTERGYVWEEVLILLPDHVTIIMLSATVPNALEFANWVGRTKQKKMYVITTLKRPVPLTHYLICPFKPELYPLLTPEGVFHAQNYEAARDALENKPITPKSQAQQGSTKMSSKKYVQQRTQYKPKLQQHTMWVNLIRNLEKQNLMPVIAFRLSRKHCDEIAKGLTTIDMTTARQKNEIKNFFRKCLQKLKDTDKVLPQVSMLQDLLLRGIGIHHSGILPILKEIVERLFQKQLVKVLFATETFAMGVNMPARTVIFGSVRKYDGVSMRTLLPAEYIQMAGRAGRRGNDEMGTVIIILNPNPESVTEFKNMMLGKPDSLKSQFRLTYSMILQLLRVEKISVEDMMSHSFMENGKYFNRHKEESRLKEIEKSLEEHPEISNTNCQYAMLSQFYADASDFLYYHELIMAQTVNQLVPGRVLIITHQDHINKLALLLSCSSSRNRELTFRVLVLCDSTVERKTEEIDIQLSVKTTLDKKQQVLKPDKWYKMIGLARISGNVFVPEGIGGHQVLTIRPSDIMEIVNKQLKIKGDAVINDWEQRQLPRFRDAPLSESCNDALQQLIQITHAYAGDMPLEFCKISIKDGGFIDDYQKLTCIKEKMRSFDISQTPNFETHFKEVFERRQLEEEQKNILYLQSNESMSLYPEYERKLKLLQDMEYIDAKQCVQMKGNVAIRMRTHELLSTELVLKGVLNDLSPVVITAVLSSLVFQARTIVELRDHAELNEAQQKLLEIEDDILEMERKHGITNKSSDVKKLNFGLRDVVYEWARGESFAKIKTMTDVEEGIIVRCIQQLNETLQDVKDAAKTVGVQSLMQKMEEASNAIKRDIVFTVSLYTTEGF